MFALIFAIIGAALGVYRASKQGGNTLDKLQYAVGFALAFFLIGLAATIFADWQGWV